jgi:hypothetical protein
VVKAIVAVVGESGSSIVTRGIGHGSDLNQEDFGTFGINSSAFLEVGCSPPEMRAKKLQEIS